MRKSELNEDFYNFGYMSREEDTNNETKKALKRQKKLTVKLIIILIIVLLLGGAYWFFFRNKPTTYNAASYNPLNQSVQQVTNMANPEKVVNGIDVDAISNGTFDENQYISNVTGLDESWISSITNQIKQMVGFQ